MSISLIEEEILELEMIIEAILLEIEAIEENLPHEESVCLDKTDCYTCVEESECGWCAS